ncbi:MAG: hypothetical protein HY744_18105 [Deltaproteobacteria bacterium]|nr:hypothetical protein [Deltaproteobacteria bacterium]
MQLVKLRFLLAAGVLHLAVPVAARIAPLSGYAYLTGTRQSPAEIVVDLAYEPPALPAPSEEVTGSTAGVQEPRFAYRTRLARRRRPQEVLPPPPEPEEPPSEPEPAESQPHARPAEPAPSTDAYGEPPPSTEWPGGLPPGVGTLRVWQQPVVLPDDGRAARPAPTRDVPRTDVDPDIAGKVVGAVASAVADAVRAAETPGSCQGRVAVTLGPDGRMRRADLLSYSGGSAAVWQRVLALVRARLSGRQLVMHSAFARGALVTVTVSSELRMPGGSGGIMSFDTTNIGARPVRSVSTRASVRALGDK